MSDFVNPTTLDIALSVSDSTLSAPWIVCTRANALAWQAIEPRYRKWVVDHIEEMTAGEKVTVDAAFLAAARDAIAAKFDAAEDIERAFMLTVLDEFNAHADKINALLDAIDAATSLANLQTRVAAIANYPARTPQQLKTSVRSKLGT